MSPEEKFQRLRDETLWNEVRVPRGRTLAPGRSPWYLQFVIPVVAAGAAAILVLAGVNLLKDASVFQPAAVAPSPTQSPAPTEVDVTSNAWTSPPEIAFDGDCSKVLSAEVASKYLGVQVSGPDPVQPQQELARVLPYNAVLQHNGGLDCWWTGDLNLSTKSAPTPQLRVEVVPIEGLETLDNFGCPESSCFSISPNGYSIIGTLYNGQASGIDFSPLYEVTAATQPIPGAWVRRDGDWPATVDCGSLSASAAKKAGPMAVLDYPLATGHGNTRCVSGDTTIDLLSGGAWLESTVAQLDGIEPVAVAGADSAYFSSVDDTSTYFVFSGQNYLTVQGADVDESAIADIIAKLNSL